MPPKEYFPVVARIVREHGGIFISDELRMARGRGGDKWRGIEQRGAAPDMLASAKGLGNGLPDRLTISNFGGGPIPAVAANAAETSGYPRARLEELQGKYALIGAVRGMALMRAIELVQDRQTKTPATAETARLMEAAKTNGILIGKGGQHGNVIRISRPLLAGDPRNLP